MPRWIAGVLLLGCLLFVPGATAHTGSHPYKHQGPHLPGLPDLDAEPADNVSLEDYDFDADDFDFDGKNTGVRRLLRFNGYIHNSGTAGTLEVHGATRSGTEMGTVRQREYTGNGTTWIDHPLPTARLIYETGDGHSHWHLRDAAKYSLVAAGSDAVVSAGDKVGFCMVDSENDWDVDWNHGIRWPNQRPYIEPQWGWDFGAERPQENQGHGNCAEYQPMANQTVMGLTPGWRDTYSSNLWYQWVDVTNVQPGTYRIRSEVDPSGWVKETDESNPAKYTSVVLPGYRARAQPLTNVSRSAARDITLSADAITSPLQASPLAAARYRIETAPQHGTLNVPVGTWLASPTVRYTPAPGTATTDSIAFSVREGTTPVTPTQSTVSIAFAPAEQVAVTGAPASLEVGKNVQLTGTVTNPVGSTTLTWSVENAVGGNSTVGTITSAGRYTAPAAVPSQQTVTIRARSGSGTVGSATIRITDVPPQEVVTVTGAPGSLNTSATAQLSASVANGQGSPTLTWSVENVAGGNAQVGTISATGLYRAPATVPAQQVVTVRARTGSGTVGSATIRIVAPPAETVTITGAPQVLSAGTTAQLTGTLANPRGSTTLTWSVEGIDGGNATVGTISSTGLYTAPATAPGDPIVTIRATSATGASTSVDVRIENPPPREPAPPGGGPTGPIVNPPGGPLVPPIPTQPPVVVQPPVVPTPKPDGPPPAIGELTAKQQHQYVVVSFVPGRTGRAVVVLSDERSRLLSHSAKVTAGRAYTLRLTPRKVRGAMTVTVTTYRADGRGAVRRTIDVTAEAAKKKRRR